MNVCGRRGCLGDGCGDVATEAQLHHGLGREREPVAGELRLPGEHLIRAAEREPLVPADLARDGGPDSEVAARRVAQPAVVPH